MWIVKLLVSLTASLDSISARGSGMLRDGSTMRRSNAPANGRQVPRRFAHVQSASPRNRASGSCGRYARPAYAHSSVGTTATCAVCRREPQNAHEAAGHAANSRKLPTANRQFVRVHQGQPVARQKRRNLQ